MSTDLIKRSLNAEEAQLVSTPETICLQSLRRADYQSFRARIANNEPGTCQWILQHPKFETWRDEAYSAKEKTILWISGDPGCGKSVLAKFLTEHLETNSVRRGCPSISCHFFFSDDDEQQKDEAIALASIVHQILTSEPDLINAALRKYLTIGSLFAEEFEALSSLFRNLVSDPRLGRLLLILDAIDECNQEGSQRLLCLLQSLSTSSLVRLKIIVTGRPYSYIRRSLSGTLVSQIKMEESLEQISVDVENMITARISRWAQSRQISTEHLVKPHPT